MRQEIKKYWEDRAKQHSTSPSATTDDIYLRELEISTIIQVISNLPLPENASLLEVGCGDGYSTLKVAEVIENLPFFGIDYSESMVNIACQRLESQPELERRVAFVVGDVMELDQVCSNSLYDVVLGDRCLINIDSFENQSYAIAQIAKHTKLGGWYIAIENFIEGHKNMNAARRQMELPEIPVRWHNLYFKEHQFVRTLEPFFEHIMFKDFASSYYFATRIIYSSMCQMRGEDPDYEHEIHQLATRLPWIGQFSPIRMAVLRRNLR